MDIGIVGNCQYNALIGADGAVHWLCWPRFDASFVFGALLDREHGGVFQITPPAGLNGRQQYLTNSNILKTSFDTPQGAFEIIDFAPRFADQHTYQKPTMLIRIVRPVVGAPQVQVNLQPVYDYGKTRCRAIMGANYIDYFGAHEAMRLTTNAPLTYVTAATPFVLERTYYFVLSYGDVFDGDPRLLCEDYFERTMSYWQTWVKHCHLPRDYQAESIRSALVLKLHQFEDTGAVIASSTASLPEAHLSGRTWDYRYCWLRDAWFSLAALQRLTQFEEMEKFVSYLRNIVQGTAAQGQRLQPVFGIGGERDLHEQILDHLRGYRGNQPVRIGNQAAEHIQHDVYGEMILAISPLFLDRRFLGEPGGPPYELLSMLVDKIAEYAEAHDAGLWEFRGTAQLHTFTLLMHWAGTATAAAIGRQQGYRELAERSQQLAQQCELLIHTQCWNASLGAYTQAAGSGHLDAALLMLVNLGFLKPDDPRARSHVTAIANGLAAEHGLLHRYVAPDDFGNTTNAFLVCSFWLAEAYGHLGMLAEGRTLFERLLSYANPLGLYSEDIDPGDLSLWGNFPQTYSHVGLINAAFKLSRLVTPVNWP